MTYIWRPDDDYLKNSRVTGLMRRMGASTIDELRALSVMDIASFWDEVVADLGIPFQEPSVRVLDQSAGIESPRWFVGGRMNAADACLGQWRERTPEAIAVVHEDESGAVHATTYAQLGDQVDRMCSGLRRLGVGKGDAVALYLPMLTEAVVATYALASIGALTVPLFSGFAAAAIASRIGDAQAKVVISADGTLRRGKAVRMLPALRAALVECPSVRHVVVVDNLGDGETLQSGEIEWSAVAAAADGCPVEATAADDVLLLAYTSGTTGRPKGAVHTHAGFVTKTASEVAYAFEISPGRTFCWITDMGWIMGPLSIFGTHANGGTLLLYEGSPDAPDPGRLWQLVERHQVSMLGVSPTLIRTLRSEGAVTGRDLSSVRVIGSTGEAWDPDSYEWLARDVFESQVPIINFSGGTEVGGSFLCPYPVEPIRSCSLGGPALGMDVDVVNDHARSVRGEVGELVCRQPWPSMTKGVWGDDEDGTRYREAYWNHFPGLWRHGDFALVDDAGDWFILGRSDDVMNVAGKRVAPAEIESVVATDSAVVENAVVGVPDPTKGEAVWVFYVGAGDSALEEVAGRVKAIVADTVGRPFTPSRVIRVDRLPKTRSGKILRRAIRAAIVGEDAGDLSGAENPEAVDEIRAIVLAS